eukprot:11117683-Lingulodinium_polyedra.AAC.1
MVFSGQVERAGAATKPGARPPLRVARVVWSRAGSFGPRGPLLRERLVRRPRVGRCADEPRGKARAPAFAR